MKPIPANPPRSTSVRGRSGALALLLALSLPALVQATTGTWNTDAAGTWTDSTKWTGGIPNGVGDTANLTFNITSSRSVNMDGNKTLGTLNIGDPTTAYASFNINSTSTGLFSRLTMDQTGVADAVISVPTVAGVAANSISPASMALKDNLVINTGFANSATVQLAIANPLLEEGGSYSVTKNGAGIIQLAGNNTFSGGLVVTDGRLNANVSSRALGTGPVTVSGPGQVFVNSANIQSNISINGTGYTNSADTAAQAGAIRFANARALIGNITVAGAARIGVDTTAAGFICGDLLGSADLEINGPTASTGGITLLGSGSAYTGNLSLARGNFTFFGSLGGWATVAPVASSTTSFWAGTTLNGNLKLDSTAASATLRTLRGTLAVAGGLNLIGTTVVSPASFPPIGSGTHTVITYSSVTGTGTLSFDNTGYRGTPALTVGSASADITGVDYQTRTWTNASADGKWNAKTSVNWWEGDGLFCHGDEVVFGDTAAGTVTLDGTVRPQSLNFSSNTPNHYTLSGTGVIDACGGGLVKNGTANLTLGGENTFAGEVTVNAGRLILGSQRALGFSPKLTVASGAAFDLNGKSMGGVSRTIDVTVGGPGDGTVPALANTGSNIAFGGSPTCGLRNVTLTSDASFGGSGAFDIGGLVDGQSHTFTKTGAGTVYLVGPAKDVNFVVSAGTLVGYGPDSFGTDLRIKTGAVAQGGTAGTFGANVTFEPGAKLELSTGAEQVFTGTITALGNVELGNANTSNTDLKIAQDFTVPGNLTKSGNGAVTLDGNVTVSGTINLTGGMLCLGSGGTTGSVTPTASIVTSGTPPTVFFNRSTDWTYYGVISGTGGITKQGSNVLTLTGTSTNSGSTSVTRGTLLVNGSLAGTGSVAVGSGATLGGTGSLKGATTVAVGGTVAPGASIGTLTLGSSGKTTTLNGTLRIEYDGTATPAIDKLSSADALSLGAASILDFDATGDPLSGAVHVLATTTARTGTFATVTDLPPGYSLAYGSTAIFLIDSSYQAWINTWYPGVTDLAIIGPGADPDKDGVTNMIENYLGTNPSAPSGTLTVTSVTPTAFTFQHTRADAPFAGFVPSYEWSLDLANWNDSGASAGGVKVTLTSSVLLDSPSPLPDVIQVVAAIDTGSPPHLFVRLKSTTH